MSIRNIEESNALKEAGETLGRERLAEYVLMAMKECDDSGTYAGAMKLAGKLKAVAIAARFDIYCTNWKCRCDACKAAGSAMNRAARLRREARQAGRP